MTSPRPVEPLVHPHTGRRIVPADTLVPAHRPSARIRHLTDRGFTLGAIASATGVSIYTVQSVRDNPDRTMKIRDAHAIMQTTATSVFERAHAATRVPAQGAARRLRALVAIGWEWRELHDRTTHPMVGANTWTSVFAKTHPDGSTCSAAEWRLIARIYDACRWNVRPDRHRTGRPTNRDFPPPGAWIDIDFDVHPQRYTPYSLRPQLGDR